MADSHAVFGTEPNCCRPVCLQSAFRKDVHAEAQSTQRHSPTPPRPLRLCVITYGQQDCRSIATDALPLWLKSGHYPASL